MIEYLSVNKIAFTVIGYPMSWIELFGTVFNLLSVWYITRKKMLTWPTGIIGGLLFMMLFYQIQLYSDALEQVYYLFVSFYGWWAWNRLRNNQTKKTLLTHYAGKKLDIPVKFSSCNAIAIYATITVAASLGLGQFMSHVHETWPRLFPEPASYPYLDALTTIMSFTAMWLMTIRRTEAWVYWIIVDIIGIGLYYTKGVKFIALLYIIFLALAISGLITWWLSVTRKRRILKALAKRTP